MCVLRSWVTRTRVTWPLSRDERKGEKWKLVELVWPNKRQQQDEKWQIYAEKHDWWTMITDTPSMHSSCFLSCFKRFIVFVASTCSRACVYANAEREIWMIVWKTKWCRNHGPIDTRDRLECVESANADNTIQIHSVFQWMKLDASRLCDGFFVSTFGSSFWYRCWCDS